MSAEQARAEVARWWLRRAREALLSAESENSAGRTTFAVNRLYYACFYAASAVLADRDLQYGKHSAVRAAFHREVVKPGLLDARFGQLYDELFEERNQGDYTAFVNFEPETVAALIRKTGELVKVAAALLSQPG